MAKFRGAKKNDIIDVDSLVIKLRSVLYTLGWLPYWSFFIESPGWDILKKKLPKEDCREMEEIWRKYDAEDGWKALAPCTEE